MGPDGEWIRDEAANPAVSPGEPGVRAGRAGALDRRAWTMTGWA